MNLEQATNKTSPSPQKTPNRPHFQRAKKDSFIHIPQSVRPAADVVVHTIDGCRKLICNMTLLVNNKAKQVFVIDSGKGMEELASNIPVITKTILNKTRTRQPDFRTLLEYYKKGYKIIGFFITHIHADHIGSFSQCKAYLQQAGVPLDFKIYGSKITYVLGCSLAKTAYFKNNFEILEDRHLKILNENFKFYPIQVNHSAPGTLGGYFKVGEKKILYIPDCKIDHDPVIGVDEDELQDYYKKINEVAPDALIVESTTVSDMRPYVTEGQVAATLRKILRYNHAVKDTMIVTTFATNAARLLSVIMAAELIKRKVGIFGRSMCNAVNAYLEAGLIPSHYKSNIVFLDNFNAVNKAKRQFVVLCTGHQGEPSAALPRMVNDELGYRWSKNDLVVFSSTQIPALNAQIGRSILMCELKQRRVQIIDRVHCSGHLAKKDAIRLLSSLRNCKKYIINHGDFSQMVHYYDILAGLSISEDKLILGRNDWAYQI